MTSGVQKQTNSETRIDTEWQKQNTGLDTESHQLHEILDWYMEKKRTTTVCTPLSPDASKSKKPTSKNKTL